MKERNYSMDVYNSLPDVISADKFLKSNTNTKIFNSKFSLLLKKYSFEDVVGLWLMHKHNSLNSGEIMLESLVISENNRIKLVSQKTVKSREIDAIPMNLCFLKGIEGKWELVPLEYSNNQELRVQYQRVLKNSQFLIEVVELLEKYGLINIYGITLLNRFPEELDLSRHIFHEVSDIDHTKNIASLISLSDKNDDDIETSWVYSVDKEVLTPVMSCIKICTPLSPGHSTRHKACSVGNYV